MAKETKPPVRVEERPVQEIECVATPSILVVRYMPSLTDAEQISSALVPSNFTLCSPDEKTEIPLGPASGIVPPAGGREPAVQVLEGTVFLWLKNPLRPGAWFRVTVKLGGGQELDCGGTVSGGEAAAAGAQAVADVPQALQRMQESHAQLQRKLDLQGSRTDTLVRDVASVAGKLGGLGKNVQALSEGVTRLGDMQTTLEEVAGFPAVPAEVGAAAGVLPPLATTVDRELRLILGRPQRIDSPHVFVAGLRTRFEAKREQGRVRFVWKPGSYLGQADLGGGVTGAQASVATFARNALDNSLPLLEGLYSLLEAPNTEALEAERATLREDWIALVDELAREGGPRAARADQLSKSISDGLARLGTLLGIEIAAGIPRIPNKRVITPDQETNLTNCITLCDYVRAVWSSWQGYRDRLFQKDLGTVLLFLSRELSVVAESVADVESAMDWAGIGEAHRQVIPIGPDADGGMKIQELLDWVNSFATEEAPRLIQEGGKVGVKAILPAAKILVELVEGFSNQIKQDPGMGAKRPKGLRTQKVRNAVRGLLEHLGRVVDRATAIGDA